MKIDARRRLSRRLGAGFLIVAIVFAPGALAAKKVWKWVDENGKTHFGDAPPQAVESQEIKVRKTPHVDSSVNTRAERTERLLESFQSEREEKKAAKAEAAEKALVRKANCEKARDSQFKYEHSAFLYTTDDEGNRTILGDDEHAKALAQAQADVEKWCD